MKLKYCSDCNETNWKCKIRFNTHALECHKQWQNLIFFETLLLQHQFILIAIFFDSILQKLTLQSEYSCFDAYIHTFLNCNVWTLESPYKTKLHVDDCRPFVLCNEWKCTNRRKYLKLTCKRSSQSNIFKTNMWPDCSISVDQQMAAPSRLTCTNIKDNQRTGCCQTPSSPCKYTCPYLEWLLMNEWLNEWKALNGTIHTLWLNPTYMQWLRNAAEELCVSHQCQFHSTEQKQ